jgi:hypothetical protein
MKGGATSLVAASLALTVWLGSPADAQADAEFAQTRLKAMSDYMAEQSAMSFTYDAILEVVTEDEQKIALASSGAATINRPDKIRAMRSGGFVDVEMIFDGTTLTILGKDENLYTKLEIPGTIDNLIDKLRNEHGMYLPAADLLLSNAYDELMRDVTDVKDIGSGIIGGIECDQFAFRTPDVDWQIWIAQGDAPYPCRYVITTKGIAQSPQYSVQITSWQAGDEVAADEFAFDNSTGAEEIDLGDLQIGDLPEHFTKGDAQ